FRTPVQQAKQQLRWRAAIFPVALILVATVLQTTGARVPILGHGWVRLDPAHWPVDLLPDLRDIQREHPEGTRIFNGFLYVGFLIYYTPGLKVFIDDRCELYGDEWLLQFSAAMRSSPEQIDRWQPVYEFRYALVAIQTPFDRHLGRSHGWSLLKR